MGRTPKQRKRKPLGAVFRPGGRLQDGGAVSGGGACWAPLAAGRLPCAPAACSLQQLAALRVWLFILFQLMHYGMLMPLQ